MCVSVKSTNNRAYLDTVVASFQTIICFATNKNASDIERKKNTQCTLHAQQNTRETPNRDWIKYIVKKIINIYNSWSRKIYSYKIVTHHCQIHTYNVNEMCILITIYILHICSTLMLINSLVALVKFLIKIG